MGGKSDAKDIKREVGKDVDLGYLYTVSCSQPRTALLTRSGGQYLRILND
jgi:hypothetical protein